MSWCKYLHHGRFLLKKTSLNRKLEEDVYNWLWVAGASWFQDATGLRCASAQIALLSPGLLLPLPSSPSTDTLTLEGAMGKY